MISFKTPIACAAALLTTLAISLPATAQISDERNAVQSPYGKADDTWISIAGKIEEVTEDAFTLNFGHGLITVEMDDGDRDADAYELLRGDTVSVLGVIDNDFFENTTIEASSVYVQKLGTSFMASSADEEDVLMNDTDLSEVSATRLYGTVTSVNQADQEFTLDTQQWMVTVETEPMSYNPLDDEGYQQVEVGDRVSVKGVADNELLEGQKLRAQALVIFRKHDAARPKALTDADEDRAQQPVRAATPDRPADVQVEGDVEREVGRDAAGDLKVEAEVETDVQVKTDEAATDEAATGDAAE